MTWLKEFPKYAAYILVTTLGLGVSATLVAVTVEQPERWDIILKFLELFLSWPVVVLILGLAAGIRFHEDLAALINRVQKGRAPGGWEFEAPREQLPSEKGSRGEEVEGDSLATALQEVQENLRELVTSQEDGKKLGEAEAVIKALLRRATYWEFEYLDVFLVAATKYLLWTISTTPLNKTGLVIAVMFWNLEPGQPDVIENVLLTKELAAKNDGGYLVITEHGQRFLEYYQSKHGGSPPLPQRTPNVGTFRRPVAPPSPFVGGTFTEPIGPLPPPVSTKGTPTPRRPRTKKGKTETN